MQQEGRGDNNKYEKKQINSFIAVWADKEGAK